MRAGEYNARTVFTDGAKENLGCPISPFDATAPLILGNILIPHTPRVLGKISPYVIPLYPLTTHIRGKTDAEEKNERGIFVYRYG